MSNEKDLLTGAMRLQEELGKPFPRDIESDIFPRPGRAPTADFDGDTFNYIAEPKLSRAERARRKFNSMSLTAKNKVRKLRKSLKNAQRPNVERLRHEVRQARKK
ncbi:hypothetical protein D3C87_364660 [compost metagenome]